MPALVVGIRLVGIFLLVCVARLIVCTTQEHIRVPQVIAHKTTLVRTEIWIYVVDDLFLFLACHPGKPVGVSSRAKWDQIFRIQMLSHDAIRGPYVNSSVPYVNSLVKMLRPSIRCLLVNCPKCLPIINLD